MKIPYNILTQCRVHGDIYYNYTDIEECDLMILVIFHLREQGIISGAKLKAHCSQYRKGTLNRSVKLYHSKINDKWYDDTTTFNVFMDVYNVKCVKKDLSMETMLIYLNLLLNKNRNFCIDHLYFHYLSPLLNRWDSDNETIFDIISGFDFGLEFRTYEEMSDSNQLTFGYCCSDCDGCLGEYKRRRYREYVGSEIKQSKYIKEKLNDIKNDSGKRNPKNLLKP